MVITKPDVVYVPLVAYRPLPHELTAPLPPPLPPPRLCHDKKNKRMVCTLDGLASIEGWKVVHKIANQDRARAELLGKSDGAQ